MPCGADDGACGDRLRLRPARHGDLGKPSVTFRLLTCRLLIAILELRHHFPTEQFDRRTQLVVRKFPGLRQADNLIDADLFELAQLSADALRCSYTILNAAVGWREVLGIVLEFIPDVGLAGLVRAEKAVVTEAVNEEAVAFHAQLCNPLFIGIAKKRAGDRELRIHRVAQWLTLFFEGVVIVEHPLASLLRTDE